MATKKKNQFGNLKTGGTHRGDNTTSGVPTDPTEHLRKYAATPSKTVPARGPNKGPKLRGHY